MKDNAFTRYKDKAGAYTIPVLAIVNLLLAGVALVKDMVLASFLGTTSSADAFILAFYIPDMIGNTLLAASVGIACIPVFTLASVQDETSHSISNLNRTVANIYHTVCWSCVILTFVFFLFRGNIIYSLGRGLDVSMRKTAEELFTIMLPVVVLYPLVMVGSSVCHVKKHFLIPSIAPLIFNLTYFLGIIGSQRFLHGENALWGMALSVSIGVVFMAIVVWIDVFKNKLVKMKTAFVFDVKSIKSFMATLLPYLLILVIYQSVGYVERIIASLLGTGNISGLNYAYRISQLPVWVFAAAIGTVAFPTVTRLAGESKEAFLASVTGYTRSVFLIVLPLSVIINILREPIVNILFSRGSFDNLSVSITTDILAGYSLAILGQGMFLVGVRFFIAVNHLKVPFFIVLFSTGVNIAVDFLLKDYLGVAALGYGAAIGGFSNGLLMLLLLDRTLGLGLKKEWRHLWKILIACFFTGMAAFLFRSFWHAGVSNGTWMNKLLYVVMVIIACTLAYIMPLYFLGVGHLWSNKKGV